MIFTSSIRLSVIIRISLIILFSIIAVLIAIYTKFWLLSVWSVLFILIALVELIRFMERDRKVLQNFLVSINQNDFMGNFGISKDQRFLYQVYQSLTNKYHQIASEREANHLFLNTVVEHAGVPMIAFEEESQEVNLINKEAKELFGKPHFRKLSSLETIDLKLVDLFRNLPYGEDELYRLEDENGGWKELSIIAKQVTLQGKAYKLIAMHNIKKALDEKELESWQKLIRVLTHEIKNSVIPISTLSEVLDQMLVSEEGNPVTLAELTEEDEDDLRIGLKTISKRSKGLASFVNAYGEMAKVPSPKLERCSLTKIIESTHTLYKPTFQHAEKLINVEMPEGEVFIMGDVEMIERVLINLVKNAHEATSKGENVTLQLKVTDTTCAVVVRDNGKGIAPDVMDHIFTPFFTTKESGSGIGLSLSRQILRKHQGDLIAKSEPGSETEFRMILPQLSHFRS